MTPLPELPSNLQSSLPSVPSLTQSTVQFPSLPTIPGVTDLQNISSQVESLIPTNPLVEAAFPESLIDDLINKSTSVDGSVDFNEVTTKLNSKVSTFIKATSVAELELPEIPGLSALQNLIPTLPVIDIPTPADVNEYVSALIEAKKIKQQEQITAAQLKDATEELMPFSKRIRQKTDSLRINPSLTELSRG